MENRIKIIDDHIQVLACLLFYYQLTFRSRILRIPEFLHMWDRYVRTYRYSAADNVPTDKYKNLVPVHESIEWKALGQQK